MALLLMWWYKSWLSIGPSVTPSQWEEGRLSHSCHMEIKVCFPTQHSETTLVGRWKNPITAGQGLKSRLLNLAFALWMAMFSVCFI